MSLAFARANIFFLHLNQVILLLDGSSPAEPVQVFSTELNLIESDTKRKTFYTVGQNFALQIKIP